jgi:hypothetical protein
MMKRLSEILETELKFLRTPHARAQHLATLLEENGVDQDDISEVQRMLATEYRDAGDLFNAAVQYEILGDQDTARSLFLTEAEARVRRHNRAGAAELYARIGDEERAVLTLIPASISLDLIVALLGKTREGAAPLVIEGIENLPSTYNDNGASSLLLADCYLALGQIREGVEATLQIPQPDHVHYEWATKQLANLGEYKRAAEVCLQAYNDTRHLRREPDYIAMATNFLLEGGDITGARKVLIDYRRFGILQQTFLADGHDDKNAWRLTAEYLKRVVATSDSHYYSEIAYAYKKAEMYIEAADTYMVGGNNPGYAFEMYVTGGLSEQDAARRVLGFQERLYLWQQAQYFEIAEEFGKAVDALKSHLERYCIGRIDDTWEKLLVLCNKAESWETAADLCETLGRTEDAIRYRRMLE